MSRIYLFLLLFFTATPRLFAQTQVADTTAVNHLIKQAEDSFESYPDSTLLYANKAIAIAKTIGYKNGLANGYTLLAKVNTFTSKYQLARQNYNNALRLHGQAGDRFGESEAYIGLGQIQDYLGNYAEAIKIFDKALNIRKQLGKEIDLANCYAIMGITYDNMGQFNKALDYYFKALIIDVKQKNDLAAADNYCNIGVVMQHLELWPRALSYFDKALTIWKKLDDKQGISTVRQNIGEVELSTKNYSKAIKNFRYASSMYQQLGDQEGISLIYYDIGLYHYYTNRPDSALYYLDLSLKSASKNKIRYNKAYAYHGLALVYNLEKKFGKGYQYALLAQQTASKIASINTLADATLQVSVALAGLKRFEEAYNQHRYYTTLTDKLKYNESVQKIIANNIALDFEKTQQKTIQAQKQKEARLEKKISSQNKTNIIYAIVIFVMAIMLIIYYNAKRKQLKANKLLADKNREVLLQKADLDQQAAKLNELNILKDRLIGVLAHDLRAPLSTLRGLFALMTDEGITHAEFIEMAPRVFNRLEHTSDFLDTLLFWINSQVDNPQDTIKSFCLCDLVKYELVHLDDQFKQKNITVVNAVTSGHIVLADPNSIRIVIHNFLTNAIKFSHQDGVIEISAKINPAGTVFFTVSDYGVGMSNDQLNSLFKSKVVSSPGTRNEVGTGMGLIFCKDLVEKYNGRIWAKSTPGSCTELGFELSGDK